MDATKKKVIRHLKSDIKNYKHETKRDIDLIKSLKKKKSSSNHKNKKK